jgi:hypothetical protein
MSAMLPPLALETVGPVPLHVLAPLQLKEALLGLAIP